MLNSKHRLFCIRVRRFFIVANSYKMQQHSSLEQNSEIKSQYPSNSKCFFFFTLFHSIYWILHLPIYKTKVLRYFLEEEVGQILVCWLTCFINLNVSADWKAFRYSCNAGLIFNGYLLRVLGVFHHSWPGLPING